MKSFVLKIATSGIYLTFSWTQYNNHDHIYQMTQRQGIPRLYGGQKRVFLSHLYCLKIAAKIPSVQGAPRK